MRQQFPIVNTLFPSLQRTFCLVINMLNRRNKFVRYIISGSTATIINLAVVWLARQLTDYSIAVVAGALAGTATTYILAKTFVFNTTSKTFDHAEIIRFLLVHTVVCIQIWIVSVSLESWILPTHWSGDLREVISSVIGVGSVVFTGFFLHRYVTFRAIPMNTD